VANHRNRIAIVSLLAIGLSLSWLVSCGSGGGGGGGSAGNGNPGAAGNGSPGTAGSGNSGTAGSNPGAAGSSNPGTAGSSTGAGGNVGAGGGSGAGASNGGAGGNGRGGTGGGNAGAGGSNAGAGGNGSAGIAGTMGTAGTGGRGGGAGRGGSGGGAAGASGGAGAGGTGAGGSTGAGGGGTCSTTTLKVGDNNASVTSGGESRTFIVHIPTGYTGSSPVPAIIDFHPLGGSGSSQEGSSGWKAKCDSVGCIVVFPDSSKSKASDNSWNAGYCCTNAEKNQVNDVQFARDIIKYLQANTCVDSKRIYASGGSNGGGMTYRMACEAADVIAAVAPVDFRCVTGKDPLATAVSATNQTACMCNLPRPIAVVAWDEKADTSIVPYGGGQTPSLATDCPPNGSCVGIGFASAQVNAQIWASFDGCTGSAAADPNNSLCQTWSSCQSGTTVSLCSTTSGGHLAVYGNASAKFTDTAWSVLKTQSLP
jgi:polyhydroxybutyrate depolymerase